MLRNDPGQGTFYGHEDYNAMDMGAFGYILNTTLRVNN